MPIADFVHLRVHSAYSLSEGAIKIKELVKICQKQEMPAVAVTDTGNLFGALEFSWQPWTPACSPFSVASSVSGAWGRPRTAAASRSGRA